MNLIYLFYLFATVTAISAGIPQLRKLIITKQSDEFSLATWVIWLAAQLMSLVYALAVKDKLYASMSALWVAFYVIMVALIVRYRQPVVETEKEAIP